MNNYKIIVLLICLVSTIYSAEFGLNNSDLDCLLTNLDNLSNKPAASIKAPTISTDEIPMTTTTNTMAPIKKFYVEARGTLPMLILTPVTKSIHPSNNFSKISPRQFSQLNIKKEFHGFLMKAIIDADTQAIKQLIAMGVPITQKHITKNHKLFLESKSKAEKSYRLCLTGILELDAFEQKFARELKIAQESFQTSPGMSTAGKTEIILKFFYKQQKLIQKY